MKLRGMQVQEQEMRLGQAQRRQAANEQFYADIVTGTNRDKDAHVRSIASPTDIALLDRMIAARDDPREYAALQESILLKEKSRIAQKGLLDYRRAGQLAADDGIFDIDEFYGSDESRDPNSEQFNLDRAQAAMNEVLESHSDLEALRSDRQRSQKFTETLRANNATIIQTGDPKADATSSARAREIEHELRSSVNLTDRKRDELHGELSSLYNQDAAAFRAAQDAQFEMQLSEVTARHNAEKLEGMHVNAIRSLESSTPTYNGMESFTSTAKPEEQRAFDGVVLQAFLGVTDAFPGISDQDVMEASAGDSVAQEAVGPMFDIFRAQILESTGVMLNGTEVLEAWQRAQFGETPAARDDMSSDDAALKFGRGTPEHKAWIAGAGDRADDASAKKRPGWSTGEPVSDLTRGARTSLVSKLRDMDSRILSGLEDVPEGADALTVERIRRIVERRTGLNSGRGPTDSWWKSRAPIDESLKLQKILSELAQADIDEDGPISAWVERILGGEAGGMSKADRKIESVARKHMDKAWIARSMDGRGIEGGNESVRTATASWDGKHWVYPTIREVDGEVRHLDREGEDPLEIAIQKGDAIPFDTLAEAEAFSKGYSHMLGSMHGGR